MVMQNFETVARHFAIRRTVPALQPCGPMIVQFSAVVVRFAAFLRQPCNKTHGYLAVDLRLSQALTNAWVANCYVSHTNTLRAL